MYEALKQTQNKTLFCFEFVLGLLWICFGFVLRCFVMVALCNRADHYIFMLWFVLLSSFFFLSSSFFSSPNLSGRRLDVYHTLAHGVALVRI